MSAQPANLTARLSDLWPRIKPAIPFAVIVLGSIALSPWTWGGICIVAIVVCSEEHDRLVKKVSARAKLSGWRLAQYIVWFVLPLALSLALRRHDHGAWIVGGIVVLTWVNDIGAYFGGRVLGRHHFAPIISPKKTGEGLIVGAVLTLSAALLATKWAAWFSVTDAIATGLALSIFGPLGDLTESWVKRSFHADDSGGLMGAHGGLLDRIDALLFNFAAGYVLWLILA